MVCKEMVYREMVCIGMVYEGIWLQGTLVWYKR
jgi:hypothetical protein